MKYILIFATLFTGFAFGAKAKTVFLDDKKMEPIQVGIGRSAILSFPTKPTKVILGSQGAFAIQYVESDIAVAAIKNPAHSNLFVYLEGRRFGFDLRTVSDGGDEIVLIRDSDERKVKVKIKND